jgi:hypothetical protein
VSMNGRRQDTRGGTGNASHFYETIVLCQPDTRKSCSACCGLFNFIDISRATLSRFLEEGAARSSSCITAGDFHDEGERSAVRDLTSYICPHQGLIFNRRPGCLLHPDYRTTTLRNESFFGEKICNGFLCPAHKILSMDQMKLIIAHLDDWYAYSIAVIDPLFTARLLELLEENYPVVLQREDILKKILHECLMIHADHLAARPGPVFFYSTAEYSAAKKSDFTAGRDSMNEETLEIEDAIRAYL